MPNTQQKLINLEECINGRTVFVLLPGPSASRLHEFKDKLNDEYCYATVNDFWVFEEEFHAMDIILVSAIENDVPRKWHTDFMDRPVKNIFISEFAAYHHDHIPYSKYIEKYQDKLLHFIADRSQQAITCPTIDYPLHFMALASFAILVPLLMIGGATRIVLFGADGGRLDGDVYMKGWRALFVPVPDYRLEERLAYDTVMLNAVFPQIIKNTYKTWGLSEVEILNCSLDSKYEMFPKVSYEEVFS